MRKDERKGAAHEFACEEEEIAVEQVQKGNKDIFKDVVAEAISPRARRLEAMLWWGVKAQEVVAERRSSIDLGKTKNGA